MLPADATVFARRVPIPLFGAGLVEAIPDETLRALEDPNDRNGDGVSGRAAIVVDVATGERRVGRFGWKSQHATLLTFGADAYRNEMGITNDVFPQEVAFGDHARADAALRSHFPIPKTSAIRERGGAASTTSRRFMRLLAPVGRDGVNDQVRGGGAGVRRDRLRDLPRARAGDRAERESRCSTARGSRSSRTCCCTTSGPATASSRARPRPTRSARRRCGACACAGRSCTTARPARSRRPCCKHGGEALLARRGFERLSDADRAALLAFLRSL